MNGISCRCIPIKVAQFLKELVSKSGMTEEEREIRKAIEAIQRVPGAELAIDALKEKLLEAGADRELVMRYIDECECELEPIVPEPHVRTTHSKAGLPPEELELLRDLITKDAVSEALSTLGPDATPASIARYIIGDDYDELNSKQKKSVWVKTKYVLDRL
jgi:hypothetical protein